MAVATQAPGFIFSTDGKGAPSYEQLQRRRKVLDAMLARQAGAVPQNIGEGLNALGQGILNGIEGRQLRNAEASAEKAQAGIWSDLAGAMGSGGGGLGYGSATGPIGSASEAPQGTVSIPTGERASYIRSGLVSRGLPEHIADGFVANFQDESGLDPGINEKNPLVPGSRGGFGLYQLTGPRREAYEAYAAQRGVNPSDVDPQLDFLIDELRGPEAKAAESIFAAKDTAGAAQAIVNNFLRPAPEHRASRSARYSRLGNAAPIEVASLDPSAGMDAIPAPPAQTPRAALERAQATVNARAPAEFGAQDVTALQARRRDPQAVPYEGPGSTIDPRDVRGLVPYTGPALDDPNAAISIAPAGMPGSSPQNEEAIRRFHAENGTTPTQYGQGAPRAPLPGAVVGDAGGMQSSAGAPVPMPSPSPRAALERAAGALPPDHPASASSQAASAIIAGDPGRVVQEPGQAPRTAVPGVNPATGMRDDASFGGASGALDMARSSPDGGRTAVATAMLASGAAATPEPSPSASPGVQRVAEALNGQASGGAPVQSDGGGSRAGAALRVLSNPMASPEQKAVALQIYQQANKPVEYDYQTMPDGTVLRLDPRGGAPQVAYQGQQKPITLGDRLVDPSTGRVIADYSKPNTATVGGAVVDLDTGRPIYQAPRDGFTLQPGETHFDGAGNQIAAGGAKPGYRTLSAAEASRLGLAPGSYQAGPDGKIEVLGGAKPGAAFENEQGLRREYGSTVEVKEFADIRSSYERLRASAQTGSGPGDLGVIFGYMKMLDPGSVVREGEFATAEQAQGVPERVLNLYNKLLTGERLTPDQRKSFVTAAGDLYGQVERKMQGVNQRYESIARQYGIDPSRVIQPLPTYEALTYGEPEAAAPAPASQSAAPAPQPTTAGAVDYYDQGGQGWKGGLPVGASSQAPQPNRSAAPKAGDYRWNPQTNRMEAM